jgi:acetyl-CoA decarbonylase/synthase complex subunit gamma
MALSGVEIFKLLPKTNCKKCGYPTCLAFAMKLAQRQASLDSCPDVSEEAKKILGEASAPPVRPITFGAGDRAVKMGEETVMFRHDKKFVNPCVLAVEIKDTLSEEEISKIAASGVPVIINTGDPRSAEAAVKLFQDQRPIIYSPNSSNAEAMANVAKNNNAILGISANGLEELAVLTEKIKSLGVEDMVIDSGARKAKDIIEHNTLIRRAAVKKNFKPLGYPIINFIQRDDSQHEALLAALGIAKYSSIVVLSGIERWKNLSLFALTEDIHYRGAEA